MTSKREMRQRAERAATARRTLAALSRGPLHPAELAAFAEPTRLRDAKSWRSDSALSTAVAQAEADGLLCSPGAGPWWVLTAAGREVVAKAKRGAS